MTSFLGRHPLPETLEVRTQFGTCMAAARSRQPHATCIFSRLRIFLNNSKSSPMIFSSWNPIPP